MAQMGVTLGIAVSGSPLQLIPTSGLALLIGGGFSVAEAMVFTMISDISNEKWRSVFFFSFNNALDMLTALQHNVLPACDMQCAAS